MFNALLSERWLTKDGVRYRTYLLRAVLSFIASIAFGLLIGGLLKWSGNIKGFSKPNYASERSHHHPADVRPLEGIG